MQPWEIKALELEASALKHLDGFIDKHALLSFVVATYFLLALLVWVISSGLRQRPSKGGHNPDVRSVIIVEIPVAQPPPPPEPFDPFPPYREPRDCDCDGYYED